MGFAQLGLRLATKLFSKKLGTLERTEKRLLHEDAKRREAFEAVSSENRPAISNRPELKFFGFLLSRNLTHFPFGIPH